MLHAGTEITLPIVWAFDGEVVQRHLEAFIAEDGFFEAWVLVWGIMLIGGHLGRVLLRAVSRSLACMDGEWVGFVRFFM
jgi:hypothetical protein